MTLLQGRLSDWFAPGIFLLLSLSFSYFAQYTAFGSDDPVLPTGLHIFFVATALGLYSLWRERTLIHPLIFLLITTALFIWGRFGALLLGVEGAVFSDGFFVPTILTREESLALGASISAGLLAIWAGYYAAGNISYFAQRSKAPRSGYAAVVPVALLLLIVGSAGTVAAYFNLAAVCATDGYLGIFKGQGQLNIARVGLASQYILLVAMGLSFASNSKKLMVASLIAVGLYYMINFGFGVRGGLIGFVFLLIWLLSRSLSGWRLLIIPALLLAMFMAAQAVVSYGCRGDATRAALNQQSESAEPATSEQPRVEQPQVDAPTKRTAKPETRSAKGDEELRPVEPLTLAQRVGPFVKRIGLEGARVFAYLQGSTFVYVGMARRIEDYPISVKVGSLIPGIGLVARFADPSLENHDFLLPHYLSYTYSSALYEQGQGIGWSIFADFHVYGGGTIIGYTFVGVLFGLFIGALVRSAENSAFAYGALVCIIAKLVLVPRTGMYSISPYFLSYTALFIFCIIIWRVLKKMKEIKNKY